jgi:hypothetical protein
LQIHFYAFSVFEYFNHQPTFIMKKILKYLIILGILQSNSNASSEPPSAASVDISDGLVAHYPFSGDANDQSGNDHHLENRGATLTSDRFGMKDSAYAFDGKASHLFADIEDRKGDFSLSLWAKANDVEQSRYRSVINIHDKTPGSKDTCQIHTSGGRYPTYQFFSSNPESFALVTQEWQHLAVSVSGKVIRFYENGEKVYSQELEGGEANQFSNIIIGKNRYGGAKYDGHIDDVYVYNRAINDAEVARLFDGGLEDSDGDGLTDAYETGKGRYQAIPGKFSWDEAIKDAESRGGHLATITSEEEWLALHQELGEVPYLYFLGGTDEKTEGVWQWITGEIWKYSKFARGQPDDWRTGQDYLCTWHETGNGNRNWDDQGGVYYPKLGGYILEYGYYTNPNLADSDGDGHDDAKEVAANTDPNNPLSRPMPFMKPPSKAPGAPPAPDYVDTITKLTAALQEKTAQLAAHEEKDARRSKELTEANANNAELVAKVESLEAEVTSLNGQVASLTNENGELKGQVTNLREDNGNLQLNVTSLNEQLVESDRIAKTPFVHDWIYTPEHGWLYIDPQNFPIIYKNDTQSWHFYEQGSINPRYFYNFNEQKWEAWDSIPSGSEN